LELFYNWCASNKTIRQILVKNPEQLYGFTEVSE